MSLCLRSSVSSSNSTAVRLAASATAWLQRERCNSSMHLGNSATSCDQRLGSSLAFQQQHLWRSLKHPHLLLSSSTATVTASAAVKRRCGSTSTTATATCTASAAATRRQRLRQQRLRAAGVGVCRLCGRWVGARAQGRKGAATLDIEKILHTYVLSLKQNKAMRCCMRWCMRWKFGGVCGGAEPRGLRREVVAML